MVVDHVLEEPTDYDEIGLREFDLIFLTKGQVSLHITNVNLAMDWVLEDSVKEDES